MSLRVFAVEEILDNFVLSGYDKDNKKKWELYGREAYISDDKNIALISVFAKAYEENKIIDIKADKGYINNSNKTVCLKENVILKDSDGAILYTEILNWNQEQDLIWTDVHLKFVKDQNEITGAGGRLDSDLNKAVIEKNVQFRSIPQTIITSEGPLKIDYLKNVATFNNNVHIVDREGELYCDTLIVYFDPAEKKIIRAHAKGNVKLRRGNSWGHSQDAIYDVKSGVVTLLGKPKLEIYSE